SIARNFLSPDSLDDRFFTLLMFMHIVLPLMLLLVLWIHLQRVSRPQINPARGLAIGMFLALLGLSIVKPALSQGPADLARVPAVVGLAWFYLGFYPLLESWPGAATWGMFGTLILILAALPWLPPLRLPPAAGVARFYLGSAGRLEGWPRAAPWGVFGTLLLILAALPWLPPLRRAPVAVVDPANCNGCTRCANDCPYNAIPMMPRTDGR